MPKAEWEINRRRIFQNLVRQERVMAREGREDKLPRCTARYEGAAVVRARLDQRERWVAEIEGTLDTLRPGSKDRRSRRRGTAHPTNLSNHWEEKAR